MSVTDDRNNKLSHTCPLLVNTDWSIENYIVFDSL